MEQAGAAAVRSAVSACSEAHRPERTQPVCWGSVWCPKDDFKLKLFIMIQDYRAQGTKTSYKLGPKKREPGDADSHPCTQVCPEPRQM